MPLEIKLYDELDNKDRKKIHEIYIGAWKDVLKPEFSYMYLSFSDEYSHLGDKAFLPYVNDQFDTRNKAFPEGQICAVYKDNPSSECVPLGNISALVIKSSHPNYTDRIFKSWNDLTHYGYFTTHKPSGNVLVCPAINIDSELARSHSVKPTRDLVISALDVARKMKKEHAIVYTRPLIRKFIDAGKGNDKNDYLRAINNGADWKDPVTMHTHFGARFIRLVPNGRPFDRAAAGYNAIMEYF